MAVFASFLFFGGRAGQPVFADTNREAELRAELDQVESEIRAQQDILDSRKKEAASLERDIAILDAKINEAKLQIKAKNIAIEQLSKDIGAKNQTISQLLDKIEKGQESLAQILRKTNEMDSYSLLESLLSDENFSEYFSDLDQYSVLNKSLQELFAEIRSAKSDTEKARDALDTKKAQEIDARVSIEDEKSIIEDSESQKKELLGVSKQKVKAYQDIIAEKQKKAAEIRAALFNLRDTAAIPFGTALEYANVAYAKTGVRPAFLLAILTQESNLGENVGQCLVTDFSTGAGISKKSGKIFSNVMKPSRDVSPFLDLSRRLGFNASMQVVSCPLAGGGWGGAMGPSQFIPSTWSLYEDKISEALGKNTPDPWSPEDAFMASAIYLSELGAGNGGYTAERNAALKYYAGANWKKASNAFYGNQVIAKAKSIQTNMIDPLQNL